MKFMVGLNCTDRTFLSCIKQHKEDIMEVYFSFGDFANGRSNALISEGYLPFEMQAMQLEALSSLSSEGIAFNMLFNANCYGKDSQSRAFFEKIGDTVDYVQRHFGLSSITTTSPLIAKFIKNNFENTEVRASVNMEVGTVEGMEYIAPYFDGYYMKRELNRNFEAIAELRKWCDQNGKKLYLLANSGCLNNCSAHVFHDNLVAHESEIAKMDNAYQFGGMCHEFLSDPGKYRYLITRTNFIRPEDLYRYESYFDGVKLATRINPNPTQVLLSYLHARYSGNILDLLEPVHRIYPYVLENGEPLKLVKISEDIPILTDFSDGCSACSENKGENHADK